MFFGGHQGGNASNNSGNIIEIGQHVAQNRFPELAEVEAYWTALKGTRQMPGRIEIDPRGIEGALTNSFMLERIAPGVARIRLAGSHLNDLMGMEIRGMPLTALVAPEHRKRFSEQLEQVFRTPARLVMDLKGERALGKPKCLGRLLILPLTDTENRVTRAIGCLSTHGQIGRAPRRFTVIGQRLYPLPGSVALPQTSLRPEPSFAEPARAFDHAERTPLRPRRRPALRLIKSED